MELEIIDAVVEEPVGGAHENYDEAAKLLKRALGESIEELAKMSPDELKEDRYRKYREIGVFKEGK